MRICVDIQSAVAQRAGVGRYTSSLVEELPRLAGDDDIQCFFFDFQRKGLPVNVPRAHLRVNRWLPGRLAQKAWKTLAWPPFNWLAGPADLYHFPNFILPPLTHGRSVVTIHDLAFLRYPETIEPRNLRYLSARIRDTVERADAVITVSEFTARELCELLQVPRARVFSIHEGLSSRIARPEAPAITSMKERYGLEQPYLLFVGTLEPRKNIPFLIDVFEHLQEDVSLVIAGMRGWKDEPIMERIRTSPKAGQIHYLSYVPEGDLPALYAGAELFVFPSIYEGFGFPPLEAMACGTPVISSAAGSLPEVLHPAASIMNDFCAEAWAAHIQTLLTDETLRGAMRRDGIEHVRKYTWASCAQQTWDVYRQVGA
ncbi:MAG: glycosyltransferase family 1 protein [Spartobacteria bacterium]|nr:glycosyltransferase family 1 protein [Spartobacteria bacterium]